jgi:hypothetical protein
MPSWDRTVAASAHAPFMYIREARDLCGGLGFRHGHSARRHRNSTSRDERGNLHIEMTIARAALAEEPVAVRVSLAWNSTDRN